MNLTAKAVKSDHESIWEQIVCDYVDSLQFGTVEVVVRDERVVEIEKTERLRLTKTAESPSRLPEIRKASGYARNETASLKIR